MKIGITCYPTYGGSGVVATELGLELATRGHEIHFISYAMPLRLGAFHQNVFFHEVENADYPLFEYPPYTLALASKMLEVATYQKLDLLHCHYAIPHSISGFLAKRMSYAHKLKLITTLHGTDITIVGSSKSFLPITKFAIETNDGVTAVSSYLKQRTLKEIGVDIPIEVIPNFINMEKFNRGECQIFRDSMAEKNEIVLSHISNFRPVKRVQDIILAFAKIHEKVPIQLLMIGDGPERSKCEELCRELKVCHKVKFLGKQESIRDLLSISDIFIMPSDSESFGLAALEAMACGVPVVSSNAGGLPEVNLHGETGFTAEVGDVDALAERILSLAKDDGLRQKFSVNALERAKYFSVDRVIPLYEQFYENILG
ncbi:MAG: N-acetyl-alpha-D-glucosaminyl L-malate synthase BshA [Calditrichaeota bacterium]|nr:MAG: N-acetyl-alpha-D-glucosaminyl L-malate synthase BshA [Calditrichota bacterium]